MKLGNLEGSPEEIKDFFQNNDFNAADYLQMPEAPIKTVWLVVPGLCVFLSLAVLVIFTTLPSKFQKLLFLASCVSAIWWAFVIQVRYKNPWATGVVALGCLLLALYSIGDITSSDLLKAAEKMGK